MAKEVKQQVSFSMRKSTIDEITKLASEAGLSRSEFVCQILEAGIKMDKAMEESGVLDEMLNSVMDSVVKSFEKKVKQK